MIKCQISWGIKAWVIQKMKIRKKERIYISHNHKNLPANQLSKLVLLIKLLILKLRALETQVTHQVGRNFTANMTQTAHISSGYAKIFTRKPKFTWSPRVFKMSDAIWARRKLSIILVGERWLTTIGYPRNVWPSGTLRLMLCWNSSFPNGVPVSRSISYAASAGVSKYPSWASQAVPIFRLARR